MPQVPVVPALQDIGTAAPIRWAVPPALRPCPHTAIQIFHCTSDHSGESRQIPGNRGQNAEAFLQNRLRNHNSHIFKLFHWSTNGMFPGIPSASFPLHLPKNNTFFLWTCLLFSEHKETNYLPCINVTHCRIPLRRIDEMLK